MNNKNNQLYYNYFVEQFVVNGLIQPKELLIFFAYSIDILGTNPFLQTQLPSGSLSL